MSSLRPLENLSIPQLLHRILLAGVVQLVEEARANEDREPREETADSDGAAAAPSGTALSVTSHTDGDAESAMPDSDASDGDARMSTATPSTAGRDTEEYATELLPTRAPAARRVPVGTPPDRGLELPTRRDRPWVPGPPQQIFPRRAT